MRILIKNAVKRKKGFLYSIDGEGNIIESSGPGEFNNKKTHKNSEIRRRILTIRKGPSVACVQGSQDNNSTIRKRMSSVQKKILLLVSNGPTELNEVVTKLNSEFFSSSIYRAINLLVKKELISKKRKQKWYGHYMLEVMHSQ